MNRVVGNAGLAQQPHEFWPNGVMAPAIFRSATRIEKHLEGVAFGHDQKPEPRLAETTSLGLSAGLAGKPPHTGQKSKSLMLSLLKMNGEPSWISLPLITFSLPSLPASTEVAPGFSLPSTTARIT